MLRRGAIGGGIAFALGMVATVPIAEADNRARITNDSHSDQRKQTEHGNEKGAEAEKRPAREKVAEDEHDVEGAQRAEREAEQRHREDLAVQVRVANAAERQENIALWQGVVSLFGVIVAALGTAYLVLTFRETRRTAQAAVDAAVAAQRQADIAADALSLSRDTGRLQLRPNVTYAGARLTIGWPRHGFLLVRAHNFGGGVAHEVRIYLTARIVSKNSPPSTEAVAERPWDRVNELLPNRGMVFETNVPMLTVRNITEIIRSKKFISLRVRIRYNDEDGNEFTKERYLGLTGLWFLTGTFQNIYEPNHPTS
jgi:hypothetical protein